MSNLKILWLGPVFPTDLESEFTAISPASNNWQKNFINTLIEEKIEVTILSYIPDSYFPRGHLFPFSRNSLKSVDFSYFKYLNFIYLRNISLSISILIKILSYKSHTHIITYNNSLAHIIVAKVLRLVYKIKWLNILADSKAFYGPDLTIFLSYDYYLKSKIKRKVHFDGGVLELRNTLMKHNFKEFTSKVLLFSGSLNKWTGIEDYAITFDKVLTKFNYNFELHIYGKGDSRILKQLAKSNNRIKLFGFVDEAILHEACINCFCFVNPRPTNIKDGEFNFPSKLLMYFSYIKPIVSTYTPGLSPQYLKYILQYNETEDSLRTILNYLDRLSPHDYNKIQLEAQSFVARNTWKFKIKEFLTTINKLQ